MRGILLLVLLLSGCSAGGCSLSDGQHVDTTTCMMEE
jgi:hypothetical protein